MKHFGLNAETPRDLTKWDNILSRIANPKAEVNVALVGKYLGIGDAYKSLDEALQHAGIANQVKVNAQWLDASDFEKGNVEKALAGADAVLVPGGFGERGVAGKIAAIRYARENNVPYLGICYGMQLACIEFARHALGLKEATSTEFSTYQDKDGKGPLVGLMTEWARGNTTESRTADGDLGGTMRLGAYECDILKGSLAEKVYGATRISERHRHRYEVNMAYREAFEAKGMKFTGLSPSGQLPEIVEIEGHPWFIGVQFHPEFKSRPFDAHLLFASYIAAAIARKQKLKKAA